MSGSSTPSTLISDFSVSEPLKPRRKSAERFRDSIMCVRLSAVMTRRGAPPSSALTFNGAQTCSPGAAAAGY